MDADDGCSSAGETSWLEAVVKASRDGIIVEEDERIVFANAAFAHIYGYTSPAELVGRHVSEVQGPDDNDRMLDFGRRRLKGEAAPNLYEFMGRRKDGQLVPLEASVSVWSDGTRSRIITIIRDISVRKRVEEERARWMRDHHEAQEASRLKDEFLATLSHELRTPLNAILGWARLVRGGRLPAAKTGRALEAIERNALAQAHLISDILDISRIIAGKLRLDLKPVDLASVVDAAVDALRPAIEAKGITVDLGLDRAVPRIAGDPDRLLQTAWNLLSNAVKFTPKGGSIRVWLSGGPDELALTVEDDGIGIDPSFLPFVFDRFRQGDPSTTRAHGGLGLGLAVVRHLVELHGGTVEATSGGRQRGARFTVRLPVGTGQAPATGPTSVTGPESSPSVTKNLEGVRILIVDDEADARELVAAIVEEEGARPVLAGSVTEALDAVSTCPPDLIIADVGMPGEDGYSLVRRLRALESPAIAATPAIALTAYVRGEDRAAALAAGFDMHLPKPIEPPDLLAAITRLLTEGSSTDER